MNEKQLFKSNIAVIFVFGVCCGLVCGLFIWIFWDLAGTVYEIWKIFTP